MIQLYQHLDLRPIGIPQTLRLSQYDSDFEIIFKLENFDGAWILDTNTTAEIQGTKTDGHGYSADATFDASTYEVTIAGDVQMTAAAGRNVYEVVLFHNGERLGSKNFILDVERAALDAETTASDSKIKNFTEMVEAAEDAAETATAAAEAAEQAASEFSTDTTLSVSGKAADAKATGDATAALEAKLADIRVGADGTMYTSAGDAVRGQVEDLEDEISKKVDTKELTTGTISLPLEWSHGWVNSSGVYDPSSNYYLTNVMEVSDATTVNNSSGARAYIVYFSSFTDFTNFTYDSFATINAGVVYTIDQEKAYFLIESQSASSVLSEISVTSSTVPSVAYLSESHINAIINDILQRERINTAYVSNNNIAWYTSGSTCYLTITGDIAIRTNGNANKIISLETLMSAASSSSAVSVVDGVISGTTFAIVYDCETETIKVMLPSSVATYKNTILLFLHHYRSITTGELAINARIKQFETLNGDVGSLTNRVSNLEDVIDSDPLASYFLEEAADCHDKLITACDEKAMVIAFTTDSHYGASDGMNFPTTVKTIAKVNQLYPIDLVIDGGDLINGSDAKNDAIDRITDAVRQLIDIDTPVSAYTLIGNHDDDSYTSSQLPLLTKSELYALMYRHAGINLDYIAESEQYGYKDFPEYGIRLIVLDAMQGANGHLTADWGYSDAELAWFTSDALNTQYQVMMFSHMAFTQDYIAYQVAIKNGAAMRSAVESFIANGGVVIGLFHGHNHWDFIGQYSQSNGFHEVSTGCSRVSSGPDISYAHPEGAVKPERTSGTVTQELWDIIVIKPTSKEVDMIRFGAGSDRTFTY